MNRSSRGLKEAVIHLGAGEETLGDIDQNVVDIKERLSAIANESHVRAQQLELAQVYIYLKFYYFFIFYYL